MFISTFVHSTTPYQRIECQFHCSLTVNACECHCTLTSYVAPEGNMDETEMRVTTDAILRKCVMSVKFTAVDYTVMNYARTNSEASPK